MLFTIISEKSIASYDNKICIPITFNNPLKVCFSNKIKKTQTGPKQIVKVYFLLKTQVLTNL